MKIDNSWTRQNVSIPIGNTTIGKFVRNLASVGTSKCQLFRWKYNNSEKQIDANKRGHSKKAYIYKLQWNFAKKNDGRATAKKGQSNFDGFP